jgi:flavin reductase (DIM6/NTAB) family NADH-FMN oxidoreductase RutF
LSVPATPADSEHVRAGEILIDPAGQKYSDIYKLMIGAIVPRPIAFVSTVSAAGLPNLAPFSYFTACSSNPPCVCFSPTGRGPEFPCKDTLRNARETGEFVINIVSEGFAAQMNACSADFPPEVNEFEVSGLTPIASLRVRPLRVAESHFQMECVVRQIVTVSDKPGGGSLVIGEVVLFHVDEAVLVSPDDVFKIDPDRLRAIGRMGGPTYVRTLDRFNMARPKLS